MKFNRSTLRTLFGLGLVLCACQALWPQGASEFISEASAQTRRRGGDGLPPVPDPLKIPSKARVEEPQADATASGSSATLSQPTGGNPSQARQILEVNALYDEQNPDLQALQNPDILMKALPRDSQGFPDWMRALREGLIQPRATLDGKGKMNLLDLDVILKDTKDMPWVKFPHLSHTLWLDCSNCHPKPFVAKAGANDFSMYDIFQGKFCGQCHDRVAFITFFSCARCHSVAQPNQVGSAGQH